MDRKKQILDAIKNKKLENFKFEVSDGKIVLLLIDELLGKNDFDRSNYLNNHFAFNRDSDLRLYHFEGEDPWNQQEYDANKKQYEENNKKKKAIEPIRNEIELIFINKFRELLKNDDLDLFEKFLFTLNDHSYKNDHYKDYFLDPVYGSFDSDIIALLIENNKIDFLISLLNKIMQNYNLLLNKYFKRIIDYFLKNQDKHYYPQFRQFIKSWLNNYFSFFIDGVEEAMEDLYDKELFYKIIKKDSELAADMLYIIIERSERNPNLIRYFLGFINYLNIFKVSLEYPIKSYLKQTLQKMAEKYSNERTFSFLLSYSIVQNSGNTNDIIKQIKTKYLEIKVIDLICKEYLNPRKIPIEFKERRKIVDFLLTQKLNSNLKLKVLKAFISNQTSVTLQKDIFNLSEYIIMFSQYFTDGIKQENIQEYKKIKKDVKYLLAILVSLYDSNCNFEEENVVTIISEYLFNSELNKDNFSQSLSILELSRSEFEKTGISIKDDYYDGRYYKYNNLIKKDYFTFLIFNTIFTKLNQMSKTNNNELNEYMSSIRKLYISLLIYTRNVTFINFAVEHKDKIAQVRIEERNRIMANLSHTVKTMLSNVIDPLQNMKETRIIKPIKIDNALRGAELIKSLVNAMNLSFKGSIEDFIYDVQNNTYDNSSSMEEMFIDSIKQAISTTFDGKYFKKFVDNFYPSKAKFLEVKQKWNDISQFNDMEKIISFLNENLVKTTLDISKAKEYVIGDDKGSALKLLILIQEIIMNAVKYSSFVSKESRNLHINFDANEKNISIIVSNTFKPNVHVKSSGLGQEIIKNFSTLLQTEPIINTDNNLYSVEIKFENIWRSQK